MLEIKKLSNKDIIQSIGRGIRPDGLDNEGRNLSKTNDIIIPIYNNEEETDKTNLLGYIINYNGGHWVALQYNGTKYILINSTHNNPITYNTINRSNYTIHSNI